MTNNQPKTYTRFDLGQRLQHILLIVSFTMLGLTGIVQLYITTNWARALMSIIGGLDGVRRIHHLFAVLLVFLFIYHAIFALFDLFVSGRRGMIPGKHDVKEAVGTVAYLLGRKPDKPKADRFNFAQKLEYLALMWGTILMAVTGLIMMFPEVITKYVSGVFVYAAKSAHGLEALLAILSIILWHMYHTHFAEGLFPLDKTIFTGKISEERIKAEHPLEYERLTAANSQAGQKEATHD